MIRSSRWYSISRILLHVLCWTAFFSLPILFVDNSISSISLVVRKIDFWIFVSSYGVIFYLNANFAIPLVIKCRKYVLYIICVILMGGLLAFYIKPFERFTQSERRIENRRLVHGYFPGPPPDLGDEKKPARPRKSFFQIDVASLYIFFLVVALGALFRVISYWTKAENESRRKENERISAELSFLRARVHPHFLFNTLNSIYALTLTNDPMAPESVYRLSQLMRYYMDENSNELIPLYIEIQALKDFVSLQRIRSGDNCLIMEDYQEIPKDKMIHAFILMPFVENSFKYGLSAIEKCYFNFKIAMEDNRFYFFAENTIAKKSSQQYRSGSGLKTTRQMLEHFYVGRFDLSVIQDEDLFRVSLSIKL